MSDVGRKVVPDKGRQNRERPVTKTLEFPSRTGKVFCFFLFIRTGTGSTRWIRPKSATFSFKLMCVCLCEYELSYCLQNGVQLEALIKCVFNVVCFWTFPTILMDSFTPLFFLAKYLLHKFKVE